MVEQKWLDALKKEGEMKELSINVIVGLRRSRMMPKHEWKKILKQLNKPDRLKLRHKLMYL